MLALVLKRMLLAMWAIWLTVVFTTNLMDGLKTISVLGEAWPFASGNFRFLEDTTIRYNTPVWLSGVLFLGVIVWEGTAAVLFWIACWTFRRPGSQGRRWLYAAFTMALSLWLALAIADEVFIAYAVEGTHIRLFTAQIATLLAIELLPETV
jgi:hypothetical protein